MASLGSTLEMDYPNVALLDIPTSPTPTHQGRTGASLDFSHLTPSQFGITTNSFSVPSKLKDKSRVSQLKARRRSTIGVRGSPETNALIRHIAKQRMQAPSPTAAHLRLQSSLPKSQTLKQKMASLQVGLVDVDEEGKLEWMITPGKSNQKGDCIGAGNPHSDNLGSTLEKENRATPGYLTGSTPPPSKRVCSGPLQECEAKTSNVEVQVFDFMSSCSHQDTAFFRQVQHMPLSVLSQQAKQDLNSRDVPVDSSVPKKKRVRFGAPLSPEFFDKTLPPSTPLQKGATPFCHPASAGSQLRSLLKTPRSEAQTPRPARHPEAGNGSPTLSQPRMLEVVVSSDTVFRDTEDKIPPLILEESDEAELVEELNSAGISEDVSSDEPAGSQAHVVKSPSQAELLYEEQTAAEPKHADSLQQEPPPPSSPSQEQQDPATCDGPVRTRGRKRKQPAVAAVDVESEPQPESQRPSCTTSPSASRRKVRQAQRQLEEKRVRFSAPLSPEFFDKTLPASTPLRKGGTPLRHQPASAGSKLSSVLKTPHTSDAPLPQPAVISPAADCGSPTLKQTEGPDAALSRELVQDAEEEISESQIPRLLLEEDAEAEAEVKSAGLTEEASSDELADSQTPNIRSPSDVEPALEEQTAGADPDPVSFALQEPPLRPPPPPHPPLQQQDPATCDGPVRPRGRKRKPPAVAVTDENEPQQERRRTSRSAARSASGKMKDSTGRRSFGKKEVNRALYGKREFASKNPLLSPIVESQSLIGDGDSTSPSGTSTGSLSPQTTCTQAVSDVIMAATRWRQRFCPQLPQQTSETSDLTEATRDPPSEISGDVSDVNSLPSQTAPSTTPRGRGRPGRKPKPKTPKAEAAPVKPTTRRSRGRRSGALRIDAGGEPTDEDDQSVGQVIPEAESSLPSLPASGHHEGDGPEQSLLRPTEPASAHGGETPPSPEPCGGTDQTETSTAHRSRYSLANVEGKCEEGNGQHQELSQVGKQRASTSRGRAIQRRSLLLPSEVAEGLGQDEDRGVTEERVRQHGASLGPETGRVGQEDGAELAKEVTSHTDDTVLAPWQQADFNIEEVLRPVAVAAGRRSVRRSLRNRSERGSASAASGLAWVERRSPDVARSAAGDRTGRRRNSSRLSIHLQPPVMPEGPEHQSESETAGP
ncbi:hypothetical protein ACEWY4_011995 [Coilia grayii]|uniref:PP1-binding domain-containing protein n=1 Tax=Coilia grayii TaxID=363190 RepID=A0ABD1JZ99_9TELE